MPNSRSLGCSYTILAIGVALTTVGILSIFFLDRVVRGFIIDGLVIKPDSTTFRLWTHPPADVYFEIYIMHVTNPHEARLGVQKPVSYQIK